MSTGACAQVPVFVDWRDYALGPTSKPQYIKFSPFGFSFCCDSCDGFRLYANNLFDVWLIIFVRFGTSEVSLDLEACGKDIVEV